jgi:hypothetical protein
MRQPESADERPEARPIPGRKDSGMDAITHFNQSNSQPPGNSGGLSFKGSAVSAAAASCQTLDIAITTAEGDRVTLNSTANVTAAYATYDGDVAVQASFIARASQTSLSVQGDLNRAEVKDIAKAIHAYNKVTKDLLSGRLQPAEVHAREINRLDEISTFSATFTAQQSFRIQTQSTVFS